MSKRRDPITPKQWTFIMELIATEEPAKAAEKAGFATPSVAANKLMDPKKYPFVCEQINKLRERKKELAEFKAHDTLRLIQRGAFMDPSFWFLPGDIAKGTWEITEEDYKGLPVEIKRLIKHAEYITEWKHDPKSKDNELIQVRTGRISVKLVDKEQMIALCGKHMLGDKLSVAQTITLNWDGMTEPPKEIQDPIEARILSVSKPLQALEDKPQNSK
jgi:hypothetical protein